MRRFTLASLVCAVLIASGPAGLAQGPGKAEGPAEAAKPDPSPTVALAFTPLEVPGAIFTKSDFVYPQRVPALFYWGLVLPRRRMNLSQADSVGKLQLAGSTCAIRLDAKRNFHLQAGGKAVPLKQTEHGLAGVDFAMAGGRKYRLAIPRAFTYLDKGAMYYRCGCVQAGTFAGGELALYDDNFDGRYTRTGDFIRIGKPGKANVFAPLGEYVPAPSAVYRIAGIAGDGSKVSLSLHAGDTGRLTLRCHADKAVEGHFAIASADGKVSFAAVAANQTVTVLPGQYRLLYGFLFAPKSGKVLALVVPGKAPAAVNVAKTPPEPKPAPPPAKEAPKPKPKPKAKPEPPASTVMAFGEGAHLAFSHNKADGRIVIVGPVVVAGKLGEEYVGMAFNCLARLVQEVKASDPKAKPRPKVIDLGRFTVADDGKRAEYELTVPTADNKPVTGKWILRLEASVPGLGTVRGQTPIQL